jgi:heme/copper-type cytochrome/quinol oxidase subunit 2
MPIKVEAVSKEAFQQWLADAKKKFARHDHDAAMRVAAGN